MRMHSMLGQETGLIVFDGGPLEYNSHACTVIVNGQMTTETCQ
jgi:hypothetical protein